MRKSNLKESFELVSGTINNLKDKYQAMYGLYEELRQQENTLLFKDYLDNSVKYASFKMEVNKLISELEMIKESLRGMEEFQVEYIQFLSDVQININNGFMSKEDLEEQLDLIDIYLADIELYLFTVSSKLEKKIA